MSASLARLLDEHDGINLSVGSILLLLDETDATPAQAAAMLRALAEGIDEHVRYEEQFIYPEMTRVGSDDLSEAAEQFAQEFEALRGDWVDYLDLWPEAAIED